jgi:hypothetical protein
MGSGGGRDRTCPPKSKSALQKAEVKVFQSLAYFLAHLDKYK